MPASRASATIESRVMPASRVPFTGVVWMTPRETTNTFCPDPSLTRPSGERAIASSKPLASASILMSCPLR